MGESPINCKAQQLLKTSSKDYINPIRASASSKQSASELLITKAEKLRDVLEADLLACDAKWMLFVAAAFSYRYDRKLYPFPPRYVSKSVGPNIENLVLVINETPPLRVLLNHLKNRNYGDVNLEVMLLLHWVLVELDKPCLRSLTRKAYNDLVTTLPPAIQMLQHPTHVFEVYARNQCRSLSTITEAIPRDSEFPQDDAVNDGILPSIEYGFYGDRLDEFYSLIHRGFAPLAQIDEPAVLMRNLDAALANSPINAGWGASECGPMISSVALCSCTDAPPQLLERRSSRQGVEILAHSSELVQVRYLLFFAKKFPKEASAKELLNPLSKVLQRGHGYLLSFGFKMVALASLVITNTGKGDIIRQLFMRNAQFLINFCRNIFAKYRT